MASAKHKDLAHNVIITLLRDNFIKLTIPCAIYVTDTNDVIGVGDVTSIDDITSLNDVELDDSPSAESSSLRCAPNEPLVILSVTLNVPEEGIGANERVALFKNSCEFLQQFVPCSSITLGNSSPRTVDSVLRESSQSDADGGAEYRAANVTLFKVSWSVACGAESVEPALLHWVETATKNKQLSKTLGYNVLSWNIENKKQFQQQHEWKQTNRLKR